jgi:hypothetical protein
VQYDIDIFIKHGDVVTHSLSHTPLDAISLDRFAKNPTCRQANTRPFACFSLANAKEVGHRSREVLAASLVDTLIVRMFAQAGIACGWQTRVHQNVILVGTNDSEHSKRRRNASMCSTRNQSGKISEGGKLVAVSSTDGHTLAACGTTTRKNGGAALGLHASPEAVRLYAAATVRLKCALRHKTALL